MPLKNHRLKDNKNQPNLTGSGISSSIGKIIGTIGKQGTKVISNPAVQKGLINIGKTGLEVGTTIGTQALINKLANPNANTGEVIREATRQEVANIVNDVKESYSDRLRNIQQALKNKEITPEVAKQLFEKAKVEFNRNITSGSGMKGTKLLKKLAMKNIQKGRYTKGSALPSYMETIGKHQGRCGRPPAFTMAYHPPGSEEYNRQKKITDAYDRCIKGGQMRMCTKQYPPAPWCKAQLGQSGGAIPLAALGAVGLPIAAAVAAGLLGPVMEAVSKKHIASRIE